jgi:hypothetical protein
MNLVKHSLFGAVLLLSPIAVHAYIGPGAGLGAIGTAIAFLGALILLIVGFIWYPVKRFLRRRKTNNSQSEADKS